MFDVSEYNGKKETKSDSEKAGQWLIKIDEDRPPSILVDSGFLNVSKPNAPYIDYSVVEEKHRKHPGNRSKQSRSKAGNRRKR